MTSIDKIGSAFLRQILLRMKELGVSQTELAWRMKVSRLYITKVLHEDVNFSFRTAAKLANALKMDFFPALRPQEEGGKWHRKQRRKLPSLCKVVVEMSAAIMLKYIQICFVFVDKR